MKISGKGLEFLMKHEGVRSRIYDDAAPHKDWYVGMPVKGYLTIGVGHLIKDDELASFTDIELGDRELRDLLRSDLVRFELSVNNKVKVKLSQNEYDALVAFSFNVGTGNFQTSTLLRQLNLGNKEDVPFQLKRWNKSKGKVVDGLINRRQYECDLWADGIY